MIDATSQYRAEAERKLKDYEAQLEELDAMNAPLQLRELMQRVVDRQVEWIAHLAEATVLVSRDHWEQPLG